MLIVCEPQCVGISHEKVNSGFLTLLHHTFPGEAIRLYADQTHNEMLQHILAHDGVTIDALEYRAFTVRDPRSIRGAIVNYRELRRVLQEAAQADAREVLFLSTSPILLRLLQRLQREPAFAALRFVFVCHAEFEDIANDQYRPVATTEVAEPSLLDKIRATRLIELPRKFGGLVARTASNRYKQVWQTHFRLRDELLRQTSDQHAFIALSPHIVENAASYVDVDAIHLRAVEMPYNFAPPAPLPANEHMKFATFGIGDPSALRKVLDHLDSFNLAHDYEIRVIGMDNRGVENHRHVRCPSPGKQMSRDEMERHAVDIDAFLILYDRNRYRLSCSGAIFEALSYVKPVLHIGNPCVVAFDRLDAPIGFACADYEELARTMAAMIQDYAGHRAALEQRRQNILRLRESLGMPALAPKLRAVLRR